jgi:hypothetical protein
MAMRHRRACALALAGSTLLSGVASAQGGVQSTVLRVPAAAATANALAVSVSAGVIQALSSVTDNTANPFPSPVTITLTWDLHPSTGSVQVLAYFASPAAAMTSGPVAIPSSWLSGRVMTADAPGAPTMFTAFTQAGAGGAGGSLSLMTLPIVGNNRSGSRDIELELQLDLTGRVLTPGTYAGTLNIRAVTQ